MRKALSPSFFVSVVALVIALGSAGYSANGGAFILAGHNVATRLSALTANYNGRTLALVNTNPGALATPLVLASAANRPPLVVTSRQRVPNLNVDRLDNYHAHELTLALQTSRNGIALVHNGTSVLG